MWIASSVDRSPRLTPSGEKAGEACELNDGHHGNSRFPCSLSQLSVLEKAGQLTWRANALDAHSGGNGGSGASV